MQGIFSFAEGGSAMQFTTDSSSTAYPSPTSTPFSTEQAATIVKDMQYSSYGINAFALLVAVMGCVAVFTNKVIIILLLCFFVCLFWKKVNFCNFFLFLPKKIFAAIYTGLISCYVFVFCIIGVVIIVLLAGKHSKKTKKIPQIPKNFYNFNSNQASVPPQTPRATTPTTHTTTAKAQSTLR